MAIRLGYADVILRKGCVAAPAVAVSSRRVSIGSDDYLPAVGERRSHWQRLAYPQTRWRGRRYKRACWTLLVLLVAVVGAMGSSDNNVVEVV